MADDRKAGIALIAGSIGAILTMAVHPTGAGRMTLEQVKTLMLASGIAHSLGIVSVLVLFLGCCGLARRIASDDRIAFAALVTYGFASLAGLIAMAVSGFIVPNMISQMSHDASSMAPEWRIAIAGMFQVNQAFSRIFSIAAAVAILLWSISSLRNGGVGRAIAIYGCLSTILVSIGVVIGHIRLNVHGMGIVVLSQAVWFIIVGAQLCQRLRSSAPA